MYTESGDSVEICNLCAQRRIRDHDASIAMIYIAVLATLRKTQRLEVLKGGAMLKGTFFGSDEIRLESRSG